MVFRSVPDHFKGEQDDIHVSTRCLQGRPRLYLGQYQIFHRTSKMDSRSELDVSQGVHNGFQVSTRCCPGSLRWLGQCQTSPREIKMVSRSVLEVSKADQDCTLFVLGSPRGFLGQYKTSASGSKMVICQYQTSSSETKNVSRSVPDVSQGYQHGI